MIEDQTTAHEIAQSLMVRLQQILSSLGKDDPRWQKIEEALDLAFYQVQAKVQNLQDSFNRIQEQLQLLVALQNSFVSAMDIHMVILRACELIPQYTGANLATVYLYDKHQDALFPGNSLGVLQTNAILSLDSPFALQTEAKRCFKEGRPLVIDDWASADVIPGQKGDTRDVKSTLLVPVAIKQQVIGVLQIDFTQQVHHFTQNEIDFFCLVAERIASAIGNINRISGRRETEVNLKESEESYFQIYEDIPIGLFRSTPDGTILQSNPAMVQILGYPDRETLLKTNAIQLYIDPQERVKWQEMVETLGDEQQSEICIRRYNGTGVWVQHSARATRGSDGKVLYYDGAIVDISGRKQAEVQIREAMKEKEVLLREIHHRVKNNLQIISSLLNLQSDYLRDAYDRELFKQSQNRVKAMALLHEKLYQSADIARIDFDEYLRSLMPSLFQSYKTSTAVIDCIIEADGISLDIDTAIPCGLIVGELVANSLKHAFPDGRAGRISVSLCHCDQQSLQLCVYDDGIGLDTGALSNTEQGTPMGWELVRTLSEQLGGTIEVFRQPGTRVRIVFKEKTQKEGMQTQWQIQKS